MEIVQPSAKDKLLPLYSYELTPRLKKQAKEELFEDEDTINEELEQLKRLIKSEKNIKLELKDEEYKPFLRASKYNVKRAHKLYAKHVAFLRKYDNVFKDFKFLSLIKCLQSNCFCFLPERDADGCVVAVLFIDKWNPSEFGGEDIVRTAITAVVDALRCPITQITGFKLICDYASLSLSQLTHVRPWLLRFTMDAVQGCLPLRIKGYHIINNGPLFSYIWAMMRPFISKKLQGRMYLHGQNIKSLHKYFPPSILPEELGGEMGPQDNSRWIEELVQSQMYITRYFRRIMGEYDTCEI